jgi:hypothetical protein
MACPTRLPWREAANRCRGSRAGMLALVGGGSVTTRTCGWPSWAIRFRSRTACSTTSRLPGCTTWRTGGPRLPSCGACSSPADGSSCPLTHREAIEHGYVIGDGREPDYFATYSHTAEWTVGSQSALLRFWTRPLHAMTDAFTAARFRVSPFCSEDRIRCPRGRRVRARIPPRSAPRRPFGRRVGRDAAVPRPGCGRRR